MKARSMRSLFVMGLVTPSLFMVNGLVPQQQELRRLIQSNVFMSTRQKGLPVLHGRHREATQLHAATGSAELSSESSIANIISDEDQMYSAVASSSSSSSSLTTTSAPTTPSTRKSYLDDGFVFGLEGSGLERPKGKVPTLVLDGDTLETQPYQIAFVTATFAAHLYFFYTSFTDMLATNNGNEIVTSIQALLLLLSSWLLADFGSGVLHWSVDNYGNGRTPVFGSLIAAFQGHHTAPWTITERGFCNNVYKLCIPFGIVPMTLINLIFGPFTTFFFTTFCVMEIMSQEFHKWSHMTKSQCPSWANWLQEVGLTVGRVPHAQHHMAPFHGNYCIISGVCNKPLDESGLFRRMEHLIYQWNGVESNAWKLDASLRERTLQGDYSFPRN